MSEKVTLYLSNTGVKVKHSVTLPLTGTTEIQKSYSYVEIEPLIKGWSIEEIQPVRDGPKMKFIVLVVKEPGKTPPPGELLKMSEKPRSMIDLPSIFIGKEFVGDYKTLTNYKTYQLYESHSTFYLIRVAPTMGRTYSINKQRYRTLYDILKHWGAQFKQDKNIGHYINFSPVKGTSWLVFIIAKIRGEIDLYKITPEHLIMVRWP